MCDPSETDEIEEDKSVKQERYEVTGMTLSLIHIYFREEANSENQKRV